MEHTFWPLLAILSVSQSRAQQSASLASPLGTKYSQSTDVSHVSFNSPLVTYGESLSAIQLPAAPVIPANLRQSSQETQETFDEQEDQKQTQPAPPQPQFISIRQFPANPQQQQNDQAITAKAQTANILNQQQQQYVQPHEFVATQQPFAHQQQIFTPEQSLYNQQPILESQQYAAPQPPYLGQQQQFVTPQFQQQFSSSPSVAYAKPQSNGYFAIGPYAARSQLQYPQQQADVFARQQTDLTQPPLVSRVAFSGPVTGFSYGF